MPKDFKAPPDLAIVAGPEAKEPVDFEKDANSYLHEIQMQIDPHKFVPCDPAGKFSDDCVVLFDNGIYEEVEEEEAPIDIPMVSEVIEEVKHKPVEGLEDLLMNK